MDQSPNQNQKYPSNSYTNMAKPSYANMAKKQKEPESIKPIAKGKEKKKSLTQKIADSFLMTTNEDIKEYLLYDWLIPGVKNAVLSVVQMIFYGGKRDDRVRRSNGESRISYNSYFNGKVYEKKSGESPVIQRPSHKPEIEFKTRQEAEDVLTRMFDYVSDYGRASMKDLYSLCDMETTYPMADVGWRNLDGARVIQVNGGGYILEMPKVEELRK